MKPLPVMKRNCATCPWRAGSPNANLIPDLTHSALTEASRICHSTGESVFYGATGKPERICRGARDVQLRMFHSLGILEAPTDEAWEKAWQQLSQHKGGPK